ncbi:hypothetical protein PISMIDRAFT_124269, partial [Pisolithus microcarpus 441]
MVSILKITAIECHADQHKDIVCAVNLQHNCMDSKCIMLTPRATLQERVLTTRTKPVVHHEETPNYILNTFSIHNYAFIRAALPASL